MITLQDIEKEYLMGKGENSILTRALRGVSFTIQEGEFTAIIGQSGSGKSTLMHILGFLDNPTRGKYFFDDRDTSNFDEDELSDIRSQKIGFVFQAFNLLSRTSALDNVRLPLIYQGVGLSEQKKRAIEALTKVGLENRLGHKPNELSGGQQQRVAVARALITNPRLILADEPTANLDKDTEDDIMKIFKKLAHQDHKCVIIVTHSKNIADNADCVFELSTKTEERKSKSKIQQK